MTELEIYKFITKNGIECRWQECYHRATLHSKEQTNQQLFIWIPACLLEEFCDLLGYSAFDDGGDCETTLCYNGYTCVSNFDEVLELYDIDAEKVFPKSDFN